jgi:hypothetical protein
MPKVFLFVESELDSAWRELKTLSGTAGATQRGGSCNLEMCTVRWATFIGRSNGFTDFSQITPSSGRDSSSPADRIAIFQEETCRRRIWQQHPTKRVHTGSKTCTVEKRQAVKETAIYSGKKKRRGRESNPQPPDRQSGALTN